MKSTKTLKTEHQTSNLAILALFVLVTSFFIFQHYRVISWDFMSYSLNAKYLLGNGSYFEWLRPPLTPILMMAGEITFIIIVSSLFLFSSIKLAKKFKINPLMYYVLATTPYVFIKGVSVGTELLTLSLIQLTLTYLEWGGVFLALAFLTRYPSIIFTPLVVFTKNWKTVLKNAIIFMLIAGIWFGYNYVETGNVFTSILDVYAKEIKSAEYRDTPFNFLDFFIVAWYLVPLGIIGMFKRKYEKNDYLMIALFALTVIGYATTASKFPRYLFCIIPPLAYFTTGLVNRLKIGKKIMLAILIFNLCFASWQIYCLRNPTENIFEKAIAQSPADCVVVTNAWPQMNYYGKPALALHKDLISIRYSEGYPIVFFHNISSYVEDYAYSQQLIERYNTIYTDKDITIIKNKGDCKKTAKLDQTYLESLNETIYQIYGYPIDIRTKNVLFGPEY